MIGRCLKCGFQLGEVAPKDFPLLHESDVKIIRDMYRNHCPQCGHKFNDKFHRYSWIRRLIARLRK